MNSINSFIFTWQINSELRNVRQEIGLLKEENQNQNIQIALLKEMIIGPHEEDDKVVPCS